jgi:hypothetical protein
MARWLGEVKYFIGQSIVLNYLPTRGIDRRQAPLQIYYLKLMPHKAVCYQITYLSPLNILQKISNYAITL